MRIFAFVGAILWGVVGCQAQSNIQGTAIITLVETGTECSGFATVVEVHVDVTGLVGDQGAWVGINAYVLTIGFDRMPVFAAATGQSEWQIRSTLKALVANQVKVVGWWPETLAPNGSYDLTRLWIAGTQGPVTVSLSPSSQLASRIVVEGNGPDTIPFILPSALTVTIPQDFTLSVQLGASLWRAIDAQYDMQQPWGSIDVQDLVKLVNCNPY